jgi:hypothetical protein
MIHPQTYVRYVNDQIGCGVCATAFIPKGTLVYVRDPLDTEISPEQFAAMDQYYRQVAERYSFIDEKGYRVVSWDSAKYVNHSCNFNTISAGYGFEIAVRDIAVGEEMTDEYGLLNLDHDMFCCCGSASCRKIVRADDVDRYWRRWDRTVVDALKYVRGVDQPLWPYMDADTKNSLCDYLQGTARYVSVRNLRAAWPSPKRAAARRLVPAATVVAQRVAIGEMRAAAV